MHVYLLLQVHECQFEYLTEGVYPAVNLHYEGDEVKLRNYYFGPESVMMDQSQPNTQKVCSASVTCNKARPVLPGTKPGQCYLEQSQASVTCNKARPVLPVTKPGQCYLY